MEKWELIRRGSDYQSTSNADVLITAVRECIKSLGIRKLLAWKKEQVVYHFPMDENSSNKGLIDTSCWLNSHDGARLSMIAEDPDLYNDCMIRFYWQFFHEDEDPADFNKAELYETYKKDLIPKEDRDKYRQILAIFHEAGVKPRFRGGILATEKDCPRFAEAIARYALNISGDIYLLCLDKPLLILIHHEQQFLVCSLDYKVTKLFQQYMAQWGVKYLPISWRYYE